MDKNKNNKMNKNNENNENNKETCSICLECISLSENNNNVSVTICNHKFHTSCILQLHNTKICPYCRQELFNFSKIQTSIFNVDILQQNQSQNQEEFSIEKIIIRFIGGSIAFIWLIYCINIISSIIIIFFEKYAIDFLIHMGLSLLPVIIPTIILYIVYFIIQILELWLI